MIRSKLFAAGLSLALVATLAGCQPSEKKEATTGEATASEAPATTGEATATTGAATESGGASTAAVDEAALKQKGEQVYTANCASCHQGTGQGMPGTFPPLAGSEIPNGPAADHIGFVLKGHSGPLTVQGKQYNGAMPPFAQLTDDDIAAVITYERTSWGNHGGAVSPAQVKAAR